MKTIRHFIPTLLLLCCTVWANAQSSELIDKQNALVQKVGKVESAKSNFSQQWAFDTQVPYRIHLTVVETDKKKGKAATLEYRFNLADLDENLVREETSRDLKSITAGVGGKQNMVEVFKDGNQENYSSEVSILVTDSKEADELKAMLREAIPLAKTLDKQRLKINGYDEMIGWLQGNISDYTLGDVSYKVSFKPSADDPLIYDHAFTDSGKKDAPTTTQTFNLADLDPYSVKLNVRGKTIGVEAGTERKQRFVTMHENGSLKNYADEVSFQMGTVETARDLAEVLRLAIPEAQKRRSESLSPAADLAAALDAFRKNLSGFEQDGDKFQHQLEEGCFTTYRLQETDSKSAVSEESYALHLGDLAADNVSIKVAGKDIFVVGAIKNGDKFIKNFQGSEQKNYTDEVDFRASGVENAKSLAFYLKQVAQGCDEQQQRLLATTRKGALTDWLTTQVDGYKDANEPAYEQHLTLDESNCSLVFNTITPKGKGVEKVRYEVFLKELNKDALEPVSSGKTLSVQLKTVYNEKHIKSYKDDEVEKYTDHVEIRVPGIVEARSLVVGLKELLEGCKQ